MTQKQNGYLLIVVRGGEGWVRSLGNLGNLENKLLKLTKLPKFSNSQPPSHRKWVTKEGIGYLLRTLHLVTHLKRKTKLSCLFSALINL